MDDHQSEGFHRLPSQHLSEQQPSLPSDELSPRQQETPPLRGPLPHSAPPAGTAVEAGRGKLLLLPHRKTHSAENRSPRPHMKQMTRPTANETLAVVSFVWKKCLTAAQWRPESSINDIRTHTQLDRKWIDGPFDCQTSVRYHTSMPGPLVLSRSRHQTVKEVSLLCNQVPLRSPGSELWENGRYGQEQKLSLQFDTVNTL